MQSFMEAIVRMGIFMICAQVLIHFRPNGSYEKYIKLLVGAMVLVQIFFPVMNLFLEEGQTMEERVAWFEEKLEDSRKEALKNAGETENMIRSAAMEELLRQQKAQETEEKEEESDRGEKEDTKINKIKIDTINIIP